jgi:hypothetical protein
MKDMKTLAARALVLWIPLAVGLTGIFLFTYIAVQQNYRQSMNDPQIQIAEDVAMLLHKGESIANLISGANSVDIDSSLGVWIAGYSKDGTPLASSGLLDGEQPQLPAGLYDPKTWTFQKHWNAPTGPETRITWQPNSKVRQAIVLVQYTNPNGEVGYVVAGRSMRVLEERISVLSRNAVVAWIITLLVVFGSVLILLRLRQL